MALRPEMLIPNFHICKISAKDSYKERNNNNNNNNQINSSSTKINQIKRNQKKLLELLAMEAIELAHPREILINRQGFPFSDLGQLQQLIIDRIVT